jgi:hypothetical protein
MLSALLGAGLAFSAPPAFAAEYPPSETTTPPQNIAPTTTLVRGTVPRTGSDSAGMVQIASVTLGAGVIFAAAAGVRRRRGEAAS